MSVFTERSFLRHRWNFSGGQMICIIVDILESPIPRDAHAIKFPDNECSFLLGGPLEVLCRERIPWKSYCLR